MNNVELIKDIHQNAIDHGWWENGARSFGEICSLIHAEVSEALEEYRNGHGIKDIYYSGSKPEGIPTELADVVIRIFDYLGYYGYDENVLIEIFDDELVSIPTVMARRNYFDFGDMMSMIHLKISKAYKENNPELLLNVVNEIACLFKFYKMSLKQTIIEKHEFNKRRPYRHGGKKI